MTVVVQHDENDNEPPWRCPKCKSEYLYQDIGDYAHGHYNFFITCNTCGATWTEVYKYVGTFVDDF